MRDISHITVLAWGQDLCTAINDFGRFRKFLLRIILGRYAYRELVGLRDAIEESGYSTKYGYDIRDADYHNDKVTL